MLWASSTILRAIRLGKRKVGRVSGLDPEEEDKFRSISKRLQNEGLLPECPVAAVCKWIVSDEHGNLYCTHPDNCPVYIPELGRKAGVCSPGCCPGHRDM